MQAKQGKHHTEKQPAEDRPIQVIILPKQSDCAPAKHIRVFLQHSEIAPFLKALIH